MATVTGTKRLLDISGNNITTAVSLEAEGTLLDVNGASGTSGQLLSSTGTGVDWVSNNSGSWDGIFSGSAQITGSLGVTGSVLVDGNVGIGTDSPTSKLEVGLGLSAGSDGIFVKGEFAGGTAFAASKNPFISLGTSTSNAYTSTIFLGASATATDQDSKIEFNKTNNALSIYHKGQGTYREHLRFGDPSSSIPKSIFFGNVGIGTTSPARKLQVSYSLTTLPGFSIKNTNTTANNNVVMAFNRDNSDSLGWTQGIDSGDNSFKISEDGDNLETNPRIVILSGGNVGIGPTNPLSPLHVASSTSGPIARFINTSGTGGNGVTIQGGNGSSTILSLSDYSNIERLRVNGDGNVGIGVTSPISKLQVGGKINATELEVSGNILANATNATVNIGSTISSTPSYGYPNTAAGTLIVGGYTNGGFSYQPGVMTLINQNTGIAAGTDLGVIQFAGKSDATGGYVSTIIKAFTAAGAGTGNNGGGIITISTSTGYGTPVERFRINQNGNVGIGTTSPSTKLHVLGESIRTGVDTSNYVDISSTSTSTSFSTVGNGIIAPDIIFNINTTNRLTIDGTTGNVGIGTVSPGAKLEVNGNVKADTLIATDLTDGVIPYHRNGSFGLQEQKMFSDNTNIYIGPSSPPNYYSRLTVEGSGISTTDIEISGSLTYQEPTSASEFNGEIATFGTFIETPAAGDLICFNNSLGTSGWREANNSFSIDSTGMLGIAIGTTPANGILLRGFARSALYNTTNLGTTPAGKKLYIDSTNGLLTTVIPTSNYVRIVGYVVEADATDGTIYFCPDNTFVEID